MPPVLGSVPAQIAGWLLPAAIIAAAMWLTAIVVRLRADASTPAPHSAGGSQAVPGKLAFVFSDKLSLPEHIHDAAGKVRRVVRVAILNTGGAEMGGCRVFVERITPGRNLPDVPFERFRIDRDSFSLRPGGSKEVDVAGYDEVLPDGSAAMDIVVSMPEAAFADFFKVPAAVRHTLLLRAEAAGGVYAEATCRLYVEGGRLRLAKL